MNIETLLGQENLPENVRNLIKENIAEIKRNEFDLLKSKTMLFDIINNSAAVVYVKDTDGKYLLINSQFEKLFNISNEEINGKTDYDIFPKETADNFRINDNKIIEKKENQQYEEIVPHKEGIYYYLSLKFPLINSNGEVYGVGGISTDITERKQVAENLQISENKFRTLFETTSDAVMLFDKNGYIECNNATLNVFGCPTKEEFLSKQPWECSPEFQPNGEVSKDAAKDKISEAIKNNKNSFEWMHTRLNGENFPSEVLLTSMILNGQRVVQAVVRDISERKKNEEELNKYRSHLEELVKERTKELQKEISVRKRAEKKLLKLNEELTSSNSELEQFAYVASHDLQEPLRMVSSFTQLLAKKYKGKLDSKADEYINFAVNGATRMQRLINDLLMYSRLSSRRKPTETINLNNTLKKVLANLKIAIDESDAKVTYDELPKINCDESQIIQLFQNLISNAIKFQGDEIPKIHITSVKKDDVWCFSVKDNGIGIDHKYFDRIFLIFQRLHNQEDYAGTGLGLALCKKIVEYHKGKIWIESTPGKGTEIHFSIPEIIKIREGA